MVGGGETHFCIGDVVWEVHVNNGETVLDRPVAVPVQSIVLSGVSCCQAQLEGRVIGVIPIQRRPDASLLVRFGDDTLGAVSHLID